MLLRSNRNRIGRSTIGLSLLGSALVLAVALVIAPSGLATRVGEAAAYHTASSHALAGIVLLEEYKVPGLEAEIAGIYPHLTDDALYYLAANRSPVYKAGQKPMLPAKYRGKLLTVNRKTGRVVRTF